MMRGSTEHQANMLLGVTPEDLVPAEHPIRRIRAIADTALAQLSPTFSAMYAPDGRYSVPPEHLLKGTLLMALYSIRSERQFCERLQYDLLFKWFLGLNVSDPAFDATTFSKNRERLMDNLCRSCSFRRSWRRQGSGICFEPALHGGRDAVGVV